ncbi:hypothetical protein P7C71_g1533, partial [Lecanoromycetidae sp. Uapishka_2]
MPRVAKITERVLPDTSLIIENGAYTMKAGFANPDPSPDDCLLVPNCLAKDREKRVWVGTQLENCSDFGEIVFRRPVEKGFLISWEAEKAIWDTTFIDKGAKLPYLYGALPREPSLHALPAECLLVVDSGFSHSTVTPLFNGRPIHQAIRRLDIGGKFLTNYLKELVSIRQYNMLDEPHLMNEVKEAICYVSENFRRDLESTWKRTSATRKQALAGEREIVVDYVLPDYNLHKQGFMRPHDPSLSAKGDRNPTARASRVCSAYRKSPRSHQVYVARWSLSGS